MQDRRRRGEGGRGDASPPPPTIHFLEKIFFPRKIRNHNIFTGEEYMRLESLFTEQDISDKK